MNHCLAEARSDLTVMHCLETTLNDELGMNFDLRQRGTIIMY